MKLFTAGKSVRNRHASQTEIFRRWKKICGKDQWFKGPRRSQDSPEEPSTESSASQRRGGSRKDQTPTAGVMFIPTTPGGRLKEKLQRMDRTMPFSSMCKYVELGGKTILNKLIKVDPFPIPVGGMSTNFALVSQGSVQPDL